MHFDGSTSVNIELLTSYGPATNDIAAIKDEYYIGIGFYGGDGWQCANGTIIYQQLNSTYGNNFCLVRANANGNLGLKYHQSGGSRAWLFPATMHLILE